MTPVTQKVPAAAWTRWAATASLGVLLILVYAPVLGALVWQWSEDEDMGHGFFVPVVAAYIVWQKRRELAATPVSPSWWGLALLLYSAAQLYIATLGAELFLSRTAFVVALAGLLLFLAGREVLRSLSFPLFLLFFMVPIPAVIYNRITFPLQLIASRLAAFALSLMGIPVLRRGNVLELSQQTLSVVEACSGIRSLLSLTFLSLVYGYFFEQRKWMRVALFVATVPIAIVANAGRVTLTGVLSEIKPELAEGFLHTASGWVIFMVALGILLAFHRLADTLWTMLRRPR
jgi:exosortase